MLNLHPQSPLRRKQQRWMESPSSSQRRLLVLVSIASRTLFFFFFYLGETSADPTCPGIEPSNLFYFTGGNETNTFSIQLLQNLADYSGKPASIRVGGNTLDYTLYQADMDDFLVQQNTNAVGQGYVEPTDHFIIGPRYFEAINRFPDGTPVIFGLNMAYYEADYLDQITAMAEAAVTKLDSVNLTAFEIGNEPNIYLSNGFRNTTNGNWTGAAYVPEWKTRAQAIYTRVLQPAGLPAGFFEGACTASLIDENWGIGQLMTDGMQAKTAVESAAGNASFLTSWNQHDYLYFIGQSTFPLTLEWIMGLNNTEWQFGHWADQAALARSTGLTYHLREMGSVGPLGQTGVSDTFGAALCKFLSMLKSPEGFCSHELDPLGNSSIVPVTQ